MNNLQKDITKQSPQVIADNAEVHQLPLSNLKGNPPATLVGLLACCNGNKELAERVLADLKKHPEVNEIGFLPGEFTPTFYSNGSMMGFAVTSGGLSTLPGNPNEFLVQMVVRKVAYTSVHTKMKRPEVFACALMSMMRGRLADLSELAGEPGRVTVDVVVMDKKTPGRDLQASLCSQMARKFLTKDLDCPLDLSVRGAAKSH